MNESQTKPKLSDIARQQHVAKASKFAVAMIPPPPMSETVSQEATPAGQPEPDPVVATANTTIVEAPAEITASQGQQDRNAAPTATTVETVDVPKPAAVVAADRPKSVRSRRSGSTIVLDEVITTEPPDDQDYPRQVRVAEGHHDMLRELAFRHRKSMNHILYNLLDLLDQTLQREKQKGG